MRASAAPTPGMPSARCACGTGRVTRMRRVCSRRSARVPLHPLAPCRACGARRAGQPGPAVDARPAWTAVARRTSPATSTGQRPPCDIDRWRCAVAMQPSRRRPKPCTSWTKRCGARRRAARCGCCRRADAAGLATARMGAALAQPAQSRRLTRFSVFQQRPKDSCPPAEAHRIIRRYP